MDFHSMKRRDLQALCKKHKIPANLSNHEMANRLAEILKENREEPLAQGQQKYQDVNVNETETNEVAENREFKKVRFSPEHELIEFSISRDPNRRTTRNSVSIRSSSSYVENVHSVEINNENKVGRVGRVTRSKELKQMVGKENGKKRQRNGEKNAVASTESFVNCDLGESGVNSPRRVTRLRGRIVVESVQNESKPERKRAKNDAERGKDTLDNVGDVEFNEKIVGFPGRVTRRGQKLLEDAMSKEEMGLSAKVGVEAAEVAKRKSKQEKERENNDYARDQNTQDNVDNYRSDEKMVDIPGRHTRSRGQRLMEDALKEETRISVVGNDENSSLISIGDEKEGISRNVKRVQKKSKVGQEVLEDQKIPKVHVTVEPPHVSRRSRRNANRIGDSEIFNVDAKKNEKGVNNRGRKRKDETKPQEESGKATLQLDTEKRYPLRSSGLQLGTSCEVSKDDDNKVPQHTVVVRRSMRNASSLQPISSEENFNIDVVAEDVDIEKHSSKPYQVEMRNPVQKNTKRSTRNASKLKSSENTHDFDEDCILQTENEARKLKIDPITEVVITNNEPTSLTRSMRKGNGRKINSAAAVVKVAEKREQPLMANAMSEEDFLETEDSSIVDAQRPVLEVAESTEDPDLTGGTNAGIFYVGTTSSRKSPIKIKDVTIADGGYRSANPDMMLINGDELGNSNKIAVLGTANFRVERADKNDPELQEIGLADDSGCNKATDDSQIYPEGTTVPGNVSFVETSPSDDSLLLCDQANSNIDLKATEGEDKHAQLRFDVADHVHEASGVSVPKNLESIETEQHVKVLGSSIDDRHNNTNPLESSNNLCAGGGDEKILKAEEAMSFELCAEGNEYDEGACMKEYKDASAEDNVFCVSDLFEGDGSRGLIPQNKKKSEAEHSIVNFDEEGMRDDLSDEAPISICVSNTGVNLDRVPEDHIVRRDETCINKSMDSKSAKTDLGGSSEDHRSDCSEDRDGEIMSLLFDNEICNKSGDGGTLFAGYSIMDSNQQGSSSIPEITPSKSNNVSESQDQITGKEVGAGLGETAEWKEENAICHINLGGEGNSMAKSINDCEVPNHEHGSGEIYESDPEAWSNEIQNGHAKSTPKANSERTSRQGVQVPDTDNDANDANGGMDMESESSHKCEMENLASACATDVTMTVSIPKVESESRRKLECKKVEDPGYECKDQLTKPTLRCAGEETGDIESSQSWTEIDLNNLFTEDDSTFTQLKHTPQGPEIANLTMSVKRSSVSSSVSLTKKDRELEGEQGSESVQTTSARCSRGLEESQLKWLFATPCNVNETYASDRKLDQTAVSLKVGPETMMENIVAQMELDAEMGDNRHEFENCFFVENPMLDNSDVVTYVELKEVESVELVDNCTTKIPSKAECEVCAASEEQCTENACEYVEYTCTVKAPSEAEYKVSEKMTESAYECGWKENTCTAKVALEAERKVCEASEEQMTDNMFECREETKPNEVENVALVNTTSVLRETEDEVHDTPEAHSAANASQGREEYEEPLPENTCECTEETELNGRELVNTCANEVPQDAEFNAREVSEGQQTDKAPEFAEATPLNKVEDVDLVNVCESTKEHLTENPWESREEAPIGNQEEKFFTLGQCSLYEEATINDSELREKVNSNSSENLDEAETHLDMLIIDTEYSGSLSCGNAVSPKFKRELAQRSDAALELSNADFQKSIVPENSLHFNACNADDDILRETSVDYSGLVDTEMATLPSFSVEAYLQDKGTLSSTLSMAASGENDKGTSDTTKSLKEDDDSYEVNILDGSPRSSHDILDELHTNSEFAINKTSAGYTPGMETDVATNNLQFHSRCKETEENGMITQDAIDMVPVPGSNSPVSVVQSDDVLSSLAMHFHPGDIKNDLVSKPEPGQPFFNAEGDEEIDAEDVKENSTPTISEPPPEAGREEVNNNVHCVSNLLASGCYETFKESDVADTIKVYTDSESSLAAELDDCSLRIHIDALLHTEDTTSENASLVEYQGDSGSRGKLPNSDHDIVKPSVETGCRPEDTALVAPNSPTSISSPQEGSADEAKLEMGPEDSLGSCPKQLHSTAKKNARTILIHGTPRKQLTAVDMKENEPYHKVSNMSDFTTVKPKRKALQDVKWK